MHASLNNGGRGSSTGGAAGPDPAIHVYLINPFYEHFPGKKRLPGYSEPQVGPAYLASAAAQRLPGCRTTIIDQCQENMPDETLVRRILDDKPAMVGFYSSTVTIPSVAMLAARLQNFLPETFYIIGGPHISAIPEDLPRSVDAGVIGEGEETFADIVESVHRTGSIAGIRGTVRWEMGRLKTEPQRAYIENIDDIPFPAHELLIPKNYLYQYPTRARSRRYLSVVASRGCPFHCSFCAKTAVWGRGVRKRSPENVIAELELIRGLGVDIFSFRDDTFTHDRSFVARLCAGMIEKGLDMRWACLGRADQVDEEMARLLGAAGCFEMHIGIESAEEAVLGKARKTLDKSRLEEGFRLLKQNGIRPKGTFVLGLPGDDETTIRRTVEYAVRIDPAFCFFSCFVPFPGTVHFQEYKEKGYLITDDYSRFNYHGPPIVQTPELSAQRLGRLRKWAYRRFFLRPGKMLAIAGDLFREGGIRSLVRAARSFLNVAR